MERWCGLQASKHLKEVTKELWLESWPYHPEVYNVLKYMLKHCYKSLLNYALLTISFTWQSNCFTAKYIRKT